MSNMNPVVAFFVGKAMAGEVRDNSAQIAANGRAQIAENKTASAQNTSLAIAVALKQAREESLDWRQYAGRLRTHLEARKMSEATLLAELKEANISHPLATEEGFEAIFAKNLTDQYAVDDVAFDHLEGERMQQSVEQGREAVK